MEPTQGIVFDIVHIHPLHKGSLKGNCAVCEKTNPSDECFTCSDCNFFFCLPCSKRLSPEAVKALHSHPMTPTNRYTWRCDLCRASYMSGVSMYCSQCDFDVCVECFWGIKTGEIHVH